MENIKKIWITWETQRRSIELAKQFDCKLYIIEYSGLFRYVFSILKTLIICIKYKPEILFVQNPSMVLSFVACIYKLLTRTTLIVDRHSTFFHEKGKRGILSDTIFNLLNWFTIHYSTLTIVTNTFLAEIVKSLGGHPFVLPDKLPSFSCTKKIDLKGSVNILYIASFQSDEPLEEVIQAMKLITTNNIHLYITGNYILLDDVLIANAPQNLEFTGFLEEEEFVNMLFSVDIIIVLTKLDYCMLCGCYEAVAAEKPLITSKKKVLMDYFKGAEFVDNNSREIAEGILKITKNLDIYGNNIKLLKNKIIPNWEQMFKNLYGKISLFVSSN